MNARYLAFLYFGHNILHGEEEEGDDEQDEDKSEEDDEDDKGEGKGEEDAEDEIERATTTRTRIKKRASGPRAAKSAGAQPRLAARQQALFFLSS